LHRLLAGAYQSAGRIPEAVQEWDLLSRLLWNAGESEEARSVVREIIRLNPQDVELYQVRLRQMGE
jgi:predicted TPR repeat methyltransferase